MHVGHTGSTHWAGRLSVIAGYSAALGTAGHTTSQSANLAFFLLNEMQRLQHLVATTANTLWHLLIMGGTTIATDEQHFGAGRLLFPVRTHLVIQRHRTHAAQWHVLRPPNPVFPFCGAT